VRNEAKAANARQRRQLAVEPASITTIRHIGAATGGDLLGDDEAEELLKHRYASSICGGRSPGRC